MVIWNFLYHVYAIIKKSLWILEFKFKNFNLYHHQSLQNNVRLDTTFISEN